VRRSKKHTNALPDVATGPSISTEIPPAMITPVAQETTAAFVDERSAAQQKKDYFDAIKHVFSNQKLQQQWHFVDHVVEAINNLATMPKTAVVKGVYEAKDFLSALQKGVGSKELVGDKIVSDFDSLSRKEFFFIKRKSRERTFYYVYVNTLFTLKRVPSPKLTNNEWLSEIEGKTLSKADYFPVELIALTNYWYSTEANNLFNPREDETAFEAASSQMELLEAAANNERQLREIINGLAEDDELPLRRNTDKPIALSDASVQRLLAHQKDLVLVHCEGSQDSFKDGWLQVECALAKCLWQSSGRA
jgi:hypothetical protein